MNSRCSSHYPKLSIKDINHLRSYGQRVKAEYTYQEQVIPVRIDYKENELVIGGRKVFLGATPCHYGHERLWFICPLCGKNKGILHFKDEWGCLRCHNLVYRSQQANKADMWTYYNQAIKLARRIEPSFWADGFSFLSHQVFLFPCKPKYMKWQKYEQLRRQFAHYVEKGNQINQTQLNRILSRHV